MVQLEVEPCLGLFPPVHTGSEKGKGRMLGLARPGPKGSSVGHMSIQIMFIFK